MKTTLKKLVNLIELTQLKGNDPSGKVTTLCDLFYVDITTNAANISALDKTQAMYINISMECEADLPSRIPVDAEDLLGKNSKLKRFNDADVISMLLEGNTTVIKREKPAKKFTTNNPAPENIKSYLDPKTFVFAADPAGLKVNQDVFTTQIKTTAEAMLDVIEDAKPFYEKIQDLKFPLTITPESVRIDIGNQTIGSVESELQVMSVEVPKQLKMTFGYGLHNIFRNIFGPVNIYFGDLRFGANPKPVMVVVWESGVFKARYILKGYT